MTHATIPSPSSLAVALVVATALMASAGCTAGSGASSPASSTASTPGVSASPVADFAVPLTVTPPPGLDLEIDEQHLITWKVPDNDEDKIRVMAPLRTTRPDGTDGPAATDLHASMLALAPLGAVITDDAPITVDGVEGHLFTATSTTVIEHGTGCWGPSDDDCFGLPPELSLRMATFTVAGAPVILWARTTVAAPNPGLVADFETMLQTVQFDG